MDDKARIKKLAEIEILRRAILRLDEEERKIAKMSDAELEKLVAKPQADGGGKDGGDE